MKNLIFTILISTIPLFSLSQQKRYNLGINYSTHKPFKNLYRGTGFTFQYNFKNNLSLRTGLYYDRVFLQFVNFQEYPYPLKYIYTDNVYRYLEIPLAIRYSIGGKYKFFGELAVSKLNFLISKQSGFIDYSPSNYTDITYNDYFKVSSKYPFSSYLLLGMSYQFHDRWLLSFSARNSLDFIYDGDVFFSAEDENSYKSTFLYPEFDFTNFKWLKFSFSLEYTFNAKRDSEYRTRKTGFKIENNFLKSSPLFNPPLTFNQYKRFDFGVSSGIILKRIPAHNDTYDWQTELITYGVNFQYNTNKIVSYQIGLDYEKNIYQSTIFYADDGPPIKYNLINRKFSTEHYSIPIVAKATFGKRFIFSTSLGARIVNQLSKPLYAETYYHEFDFGLETPLSSESIRYETPFKTQLNCILGFSFGYSFKERVTLNLDFRKTFKNRNDNIFNSYTINYDLVPSLSLKYNFNLKRNSNFKFSTYKLTFKPEEK